MGVHLRIDACYGTVDDGTVFEFDGYRLVVELHQESVEERVPR